MIRKIMLGGIFLSVSFFLVKLLSFFYVPILTRFLGPEGMGTFNLAILLVPWAVSLASLSLSAVATQLVAEQDPSSSQLRSVLGTMLYVGIFLGGVSTVLYFFLVPFIAVHFFWRHRP